MPLNQSQPARASAAGPARRIGFALSTKDRTHLTRQILPGLDCGGFDLIWCDGSTTPEGKALPGHKHFARTNLKEIFFGVGGGPDTAIRFSLQRLLALGYDYVGLIENDVRLRSGWLPAMLASWEAAERDGFTVGAATARSIASRVLARANGYVVQWNMGAGMVLFTRAAAQAVLADYHLTTAAAIRRFYQARLGVDLAGVWELFMDQPDRALGADWHYAVAMFNQGLIPIGTVPGYAENIDSDQEKACRTHYVRSATDALPAHCLTGEGLKLALRRAISATVPAPARCAGEARGTTAPNPSRILWVRTDAIGDAVLAASMLPHVRRRFPNAHLAVLCQEHLAEFYAPCPHLNTIICFNTARLRHDVAYRESIVGEIRSFAPELILNSIYSRETTVEGLLLHLSGTRAIGMEGNLSNISAADRQIADTLYTRLIPSAEPRQTELDHHRDFLAGLGIPAENLAPTVWTTPEDEARADAFFAQHELDPQRTIALFPGSQMAVKIYPRYVQALHGLKGYRFLVLGGADAAARCDALAAELPGPALALAGRTTLPELAALIRRCRLLVGADSSGAHVACAVGVPNVVVLGGGQFGRFFPYSRLTSAVVLPLDCFQCNWHCRFSRGHCIQDLAPEVVAEAIRATLAEPSEKPRVFVQTAHNVAGINQPLASELGRWLRAETVEVIHVHPLNGREQPAAARRAPSPTVPAAVRPEHPPQAAGPVVSAIVSAYKSERFMRGCLEDLVSQTLFQRGELEIVVVDSASPENEQAIVAEFQKRYPQILYLRTNERETIYDAWNRGIQAAHGRYVTNANTDDRHRRDALEILARTLDQNPDITLVYADCLITRTENETFETAHPVRRFQWHDFNPADLLLKGCFVGPQPMWRREVHDEHGFFDATFVSAGDYEFWLRIARTRKFLHVKEILGLYLESPASIEHRNQELAARETIEARRRHAEALVPGFKLVPNGEAQPGGAAQVPAATPPVRHPQAEASLPPCARVGDIVAARELVRSQHLEEAWNAALAAVQARPFHPEAFLLLAQVALAAGAGDAARRLAQHARRLAPAWKPARKFLKSRFYGNANPGWLRVPDFLDPQSAAAPRLSVCVIARNEEKFLGGCLESVRGVADQLIVVDTGSTDRTVEIAQTHGAEVLHFEWCDDFSAARNAALERATGDWILSLDADEELSAEGREQLRQHLADPAVMAWRLPLIDKGKEAEGTLYVPRLFRNAPGLHYVNRIHEQLFVSLDRQRHLWGLDNRLGEALLIHHGYSAEVMRDRRKVERNLRLLEMAITENPSDAYLLMQLGLELKRSGRTTEGLERYREAYRLLLATPTTAVPPELREGFLSQFCGFLRTEKQFAELVEVMHSRLARDSGDISASLHFSHGLAQLELGNFREAAGQFEQCLAKRGQRTFSRIDRDINTAGPHHCLAVCRAQLGDTAGAEQAFEEGLKQTGHVDRLRLDYAQYLAERDRPLEALRILNEAIAEETPSTAAAWRLGGRIALSRPEFLEFARDWTAEALRHLPTDYLVRTQRAEALLLSGKIEEARPLWELAWEAEGRIEALAALVLCETVEGSIRHRPQSSEQAEAAARAFVGWYRRLIDAGAGATVFELHARAAELRGVLPEAARVLEAVKAEADSEEPVPCATPV